MKLYRFLFIAFTALCFLSCNPPENNVHYHKLETRSVSHLYNVGDVIIFPSLKGYYYCGIVLEIEDREFSSDYNIALTDYKGKKPNLETIINNCSFYGRKIPSGILTPLGYYIMGFDVIGFGYNDILKFKKKLKSLGTINFKKGYLAAGTITGGVNFKDLLDYFNEYRNEGLEESKKYLIRSFIIK